MTIQTLDRTSRWEADASFRQPSELQPLVLSLRLILKQIDDEYERERDKLSQTLPDTCVKDRPLVLLKARRLGRRESDVRDLAVLIGQLTWELVRQDAGSSEQRSDLRLVFDIQGLSPLHDLARVQRQLQLTCGRCSHAAAP